MNFAKKISVLLESGMVRKTLENGNDWRGIVDGFNVWIGSPSGSRSGKFEYQVRDGGKFAVMGDTRSFSSMAKALANAIEVAKARNTEH